MDTIIRDLTDRIPCRTVQITFLANIFGEDDWPLPCSLFLYGHRGTGKTLVTTAVLEKLDIVTSHVNCVEFYTSRIMYETILNHLSGTVPSAGNGYASYTSCDNLGDFVHHLRKINCERSNPRMAIVLENSERLRDCDVNILPAFCRLQELAREINITVIFCSALPIDKFRPSMGIMEPVVYHFPQYTKDELVEVLMKGKPSSCSAYFYKNYINIVLSVFFLATKSLPELKHQVQLHFKVYCDPIAKGDAKEDDIRKLWKNVEPHLKKALDSVYLREVSSAQFERMQQLTESTISHDIPHLKSTGTKDPIPPSAWFDTLDGSESPPVCPQLDPDAIQQGQILVQGDEDCLYLNVYTPRPYKSDLPVIVWIHGGAFIAGGAEQFAPLNLLKKDVVLVSIQYRLGALGFLSTGDDVLPGNFALKDQTMALRWVKENIREFGGDPEQITLLGHSSGAVSAHFQVLSPNARGLFQRAILQSGSALSPWAIRSDHWKIAHTIGQIHNCSGITTDPPALDSTMLLYCLQDLDVEDLVVLPSYFTVWQNAPTVMVPRVDGVYLPDYPATLLMTGRYNKVDLISGFNKDEGALESMPLLLNASTANEIALNFETIAPTMLKLVDEEQATTLAEMIFKYYLADIPVNEVAKERLVQMLSDGGFKVPQDEIALLHARQQNVFVYELQHRGQNSMVDLFNASIGKNWVSHADDLQYLFKKSPYFPPLEREDDLRVRDIMINMWTNFAATGLPTPDTSMGFVWLPMTPFCFRYLAFTTIPYITGYDRGVRTEFWRYLPLARNKILYPERFQFRGPLFFQPPPPPPPIPFPSCGDPPIGIGAGNGGSFFNWFTPTFHFHRPRFWQLKKKLEDWLEL